MLSLEFIKSFLWTLKDLFKKVLYLADNNTINSPAGALFIRGVEVFNSTSATTGSGTWLEKKDQTYLSEYTDRLTGPEGDLTAQDVTGFPKILCNVWGCRQILQTLLQEVCI